MSEAPICLVSMPFTPGTMPALGISLLKAGLCEAGIGCDVVYGSTHLIDALARRSDLATALFDYQLIGSTGHLGDLMFAPAYWDDRELDEDVRQSLALAATSLPARSRRAFCERLDPAHSPIAAALERTFMARDWRSYSIVGFSSTFAQSLASLWLARRIKAAAPETLILFGGANVDGTMGLALLDAFPFVDHVLQGEADRTLRDYVDAVLNGRSLAGIPGLVMRGPKGPLRIVPARPVTELDTLAAPDFSDYFDQLPESWTRDHIMLPFETSRGCWWGESSHCVFCGLNADAMGYRAKSADRALEEIDTLRARWPIRRFWAVDNILPREYFESFLPALGKRGLTVFYETKANLHDWQVAGLAAAGVTQIQPGIESLSTRLLKLMKKGVSRSRNIQLLRSCQAHCVDPLWFYLHGLPGDAVADYLDDAALMERLVHLPPPRSINPVTVDRFSPLYRNSDEHALSLAQQPEHRLAFAGLSDEQSAALCYHFEAQVGTAHEADYRPVLVDALAWWQARYEAGAQLAMHTGKGCTLLFDDRRTDGPRVLLLTGLVHAVHAAIDRGATLRLVEERCASLDDGQPDPSDLAIIIAAARHDAEFSPPMSNSGEALEWLDERWLVARDGAVWQALAVPGLPMMTALRLGLEAEALGSLAVDASEPEMVHATC